MKTFAIYEQSENNRVAVKVGFSWPGFFLSMIWLLFARLWERAGITAGCTVALYIIALIFASFSAPGTVNFIMTVGGVVIGIIIGENGNRWRRTNLRARGFGLVAVVESESKDEALAKLREMSPKKLSAAKELAAYHLRKVEAEIAGARV